MAEETTEKTSFSLGTYLSESVDELKKVSKPTRQETMQYTLVSIVIICFIAICIMLLDLVFDQIMRAVL